MRTRFQAAALALAAAALTASPARSGFLDKLFGLGFATCKDAGFLCEKAVLMGGSPVTAA